MNHPGPHVKLRRACTVICTNKANSFRSIIGLPGLVFELAGHGAEALEVVGPPGTTAFVHACQSFARRKHPAVSVREIDITPAKRHAVSAEIAEQEKCAPPKSVSEQVVSPLSSCQQGAGPRADSSDAGSSEAGGSEPSGGDSSSGEETDSDAESSSSEESDSDGETSDDEESVSDAARNCTVPCTSLMPHTQASPTISVLELECSTATIVNCGMIRSAYLVDGHGQFLSLHVVVTRLRGGVEHSLLIVDFGFGAAHTSQTLHNGPQVLDRFGDYVHHLLLGSKSLGYVFHMADEAVTSHRRYKHALDSFFESQHATAKHLYVCADQNADLAAAGPILPLTSRTQLKLHCMMPNFVHPPSWDGINGRNARRTRSNLKTQSALLANPRSRKNSVQGAERQHCRQPLNRRKDHDARWTFGEPFDLPPVRPMDTMQLNTQPSLSGIKPTHSWTWNDTPNLRRLTSVQSQVAINLLREMVRQADGSMRQPAMFAVEPPGPASLLSNFAAARLLRCPPSKQLKVHECQKLRHDVRILQQQFGESHWPEVVSAVCSNAATIDPKGQGLCGFDAKPSYANHPPALVHRILRRRVLGPSPAQLFEAGEVVFLGTGAAAPSRDRGCSSIYVHLSNYMPSPSHPPGPPPAQSSDACCALPLRGHQLNACSRVVHVGCGALIDVGEGAWQQLQSMFGARVSEAIVANLSFIWISHYHADHHMGLARILTERSAQASTYWRTRKQILPKLLIVGPRALGQFLQTLRAASSWQLHEVPFVFVHSTEFNMPGNPAARMLDGLGHLHSVPVIHCPDSFGLVLNLSVPVNPEQGGWCGTRGVKLVYSGDTRPCENLIRAGSGAQLLIHEATFESKLLSHARRKRHCTVDEAVDVSLRMQVWFL
eukprot:INCI7184.20.p1 GENE.INCI7184.20~~INCI7184.20.p1  ORF type:complete len:887 (+),score=107.38 INCI7184.20:670-3330(+)